MCVKFILKIFILFLAFEAIENTAMDIPSDFCKGIEFEVFAHPDPKRCVDYVICFFEIPFITSCLRQNEIFYQRVSDCVPGRETVRSKLLGFIEFMFDSSR